MSVICIALSYYQQDCSVAGLNLDIHTIQKVQTSALTSSRDMLTEFIAESTGPVDTFFTIPSHRIGCGAWLDIFH